MAFPLTPTVGQIHTEIDIKYEWTGTSWDLVTETYQKLIESTVDPTPADVALQGQVWRNTTSGHGWEYSENSSTGASEWVRIVSEKSVQIATAAPTTQADGTSLQPGDIWVDSANSNTAYYRTTTNTWEPLTIFFDNAVANLTGPPVTTQAAIDVLALRANSLSKGISFVGTYDATNNTADFTAPSGLTDGTLPAAGVTNKDTYLVVGTDGTPATGPLAGTSMATGDWIISDGATWTHLSLSTSSSTFTALTDTPVNYTGMAGRIVSVNSTETALEFVSSVDTHSILAATEPTIRPGGAALASGDRWVDSNTLNTYAYNGTAFVRVVPTIVSTSAPVQTTEGLLWYNPSVNTLFVRDNTAAAWIGI